MKQIVLSLLLALTVNLSALADELSDLYQVKKEIVETALIYQGLGDPDFKIQNTLEPLVQKLLALAPQKPIQERIELLDGTWKQVWGPYDYRNDDRGVDPEIGVTEIYQMVSKEGYYYNVSPLYKNGDLSNVRIGLLRGEFKLNPNNPNGLDVAFTKYRGVEGRPVSDIWTLAPLSEAGTLENEITIVPDIVVKLFFKGGTLIEVYTDDTLRILYGTGSNFSKPYLYIMTRIP